MAATRANADMSGWVAIVTGAGARDGGIDNGRAAAILLAEAGAHVLAVDRKPELAQATAEMISAEGGSAVAAGVDVTIEADCEAMTQAALDRWGRIDILLNNVGIGSDGTVVTSDVEAWKRVMDVNLTSMVLASRHAMPATIERPGGGAVVNISSSSALRPRGMTAHSTSKGAIMALTSAMAVDHGADGVRVNCGGARPRAHTAGRRRRDA